MKYESTDEQKAVVTHIKKGEQILLVDATAGSGKTSTAQLVVNTIKPKRTLYTAFNKAIVKESAAKFPNSVECKTLHALALSYVRPKLPIEPFTYLCVKEKLSYPDKYAVIKAIDEFYRSRSIDVYKYMDTKLTKEKLRPIACKYVEGMFEDRVNPTFNFLLKYFHLLLDEGQVDPKYDMVIFDELQDSTEVALEIFKALKCDKKMGLGDQFQAIYGFMNLVNGFELLVNVSDTLHLTQSFRCSIPIAKKVEKFCKKYLSKDFTFIGTENPVKDGKTAFITATNAKIVERINMLHKEKKGYTLTRPLKEIFAAPLALATVSGGKEVLHKQYKFLNKEYKNYTMSSYQSFFHYIKKEVEDEEIHSAVDLLMKFKAENINIFNVLADAKKAKKDPKLTVGTFYSLKGLGYETVYIENDLNGAVEASKEAVLEGVDTDNHHTYLKGYYVACTRARINLHNAIEL